MPDMNLTKAERLIIANQFAILEFLSTAFPNVAQRGNNIVHDPQWYVWAQDVMRAGHSVLVDQVCQVYDEDLSEHDQREILSILDMYRHIQSSFDDLEDKEGLTEDNIRFGGWDGHRNELSFARQFCFRNEDGQGFNPDATPSHYDMIRPSPAFDSHWPTIYRYRAMLTAYEPIKRNALNAGWRGMTAEEIKTVLNVTVE